MSALAPFQRPDEDAPLRRGRDGAVAILTLDRSERRNALSENVLIALSAALDQIAEDSSIRVVVVTSEGPVFSSGHDLKELTAHRGDPDGGRAYSGKIFGLCSSVMQSVVALPQPVIAAVEGLATAAGCQLVASCDLAVAGADARFQTPGANFGLFCSTPMVALTRAVAPKAAMEMLLTGEPIAAEEALRIGLVNRVVPAGAALEGAMALARRIATRAPEALAIGKRALRTQAGLPLDEAYRICSAVMVENLMNAEAEAGVAAILDKRAPRFEP